MKKILLSITVLIVFAIPCTAFADTTPVWTATYDRGVSDKASGIQTDASDNLYVYGTTEGLPTLVKYSPSGDLVWEMTLDSISYFMDMNVDPDGNIYVTGELAGTGSMVKYDTDGNLLWQQARSIQYPGSYGDYARFTTLSVDGSGTIHVVFEEMYRYTRVNPYPYFWYYYYVPRHYLQEYDAQGALLSSIQIDSGYNSDMVVSLSGDETYLVGGTLKKYSRDGVKLWESASSLGGILTSVALDQDGNIAAGGYYYNEYKNNVLIAAYDGNGNALWEYAGSDDEAEDISGIAVDRLNAIHAVGTSDGDQILLITLESDGSLRSKVTYREDDLNTSGVGIIAASDDSVVISGTTELKSRNTIVGHNIVTLKFR